MSRQSEPCLETVSTESDNADHFPVFSLLIYCKMQYYFVFCYV